MFIIRTSFFNFLVEAFYRNWIKVHLPLFTIIGNHRFSHRCSPVFHRYRWSSIFTATGDHRFSHRFTGFSPPRGQKNRWPPFWINRWPPLVSTYINFTYMHICTTFTYMHICKIFTYMHICTKFTYMHICTDIYIYAYM